MPLSDSDLLSLVSSPSLSGVIYQARTLIIELERINDEEFPHEACLIRDVFLCVAEHVLEELRELLNPAEPFNLPTESASRLRELARYVRNIHSYIRYLSASSARQSPPAVQDELVRLTKRHFPQEYGDPVCIVRPQWTYNLKCVPLSQELKKMSKENLDPANKLKLKSGDSVIQALWKKRLEQGKKMLSKTAPSQIGVLSFASIDTPDALFIPLLGHELGHFIAFSRPIPFHEEPDLLESAQISEEKVREIIQDVTKKTPNPNETTRYHSTLCNQVWICLRELLADRLAARMLGFSFFVAQAKFIKTSLSWYQPLILESGYPNIKLRLSEIFKQITAADYPGNPLPFLEENSRTYPHITKPLISYVELWQRHFDDLPITVRSKSGLFPEELFVEPFYKLVEEALNPQTLKILSEIAERVIPDANCARLTSNFFERMIRLEQDLPPSVPNENIDSFAEILSAAWSYQIVYGESRENEMSKNNRRFDEHSKTCRLMLKAIELIPVQTAKLAEELRTAALPQSVGTRSKSRLLRGFRKIPGAKKLISRMASLKGDEYSKKGVLSSTEIHRRALLPMEDPSRINISPLRINSINGASIDVHLGNWFAYARRTKLKGIKIEDERDEALLKSIGQDEAFIPFGKAFLLHPGDLALGVTQEFISLPRDVMAFVEGRSRLGRMGLFVATATQVAPTFHGVVVLELANAGTVPLELRPGIGIAQLVFQVMTDPVPEEKLYRSKYYCQIKPLI
jgi:dCTP deaminase